MKYYTIQVLMATVIIQKMIETNCNNKPMKKKGKTVGYCRVSSNKQKEDLERQIANM